MIFLPIVTKLDHLSIYFSLFHLSCVFAAKGLAQSASVPLLRIVERVRFPCNPSRCSHKCDEHKCDCMFNKNCSMHFWFLRGLSLLKQLKFECSFLNSFVEKNQVKMQIKSSFCKLTQVELLSFFIFKSVNIWMYGLITKFSSVLIQGKEKWCEFHTWFRKIIFNHHGWF